MQNSELSSLAGGMFTSCPGCLKQFRVQASQLSTAGGHVQCGACDYNFDALSRLSDAPLTLEQMNYRFAKMPVEKTTADEQPESVTSPSTKDNASSFAKAGFRHESSEEILGDIQAELDRDFLPKRSLLAMMLWGFGALFLLIIIIVQLAWFNRDELLLRYPQLKPIAIKVCERLQCDIFRYKNISSIKLLNRDVRNHPLHQDSLLVNATMANKAQTIQPFPLIQLALFNLAGEVIGHRKFKPEEYLDDSINIPAGMMPDATIHFALEVGGSTESATSFEFRFL